MADEKRTESGKPVDVPAADYIRQFDGEGLTPEQLVGVINSQRKENDMLRGMVQQERRKVKGLVEYNKILFDNLRQINDEVTRGGADAGEDDDVERLTGPADDLLEGIKEEYKTLRSNLDDAEQKDADVKKELNLKTDAAHEEVVEKIREIQRSGEMSQEKLEQIESKYHRIRGDKIILEIQCEDLQSTIDLHHSEWQQNEEFERQTRQLRTRLPLMSVQGAPAPRSARPAGRPPRKQPGRQISSTLPSLAASDRCVFCCKAIVDHKDRWCSSHLMVLNERKKFGCCGTAETGCVTVPRLRLVKDHASDKIFITDDSTHTMQLS